MKLFLDLTAKVWLCIVALGAAVLLVYVAYHVVRVAPIVLLYCAVAAFTMWAMLRILP
jgi:hypothetical protein